MALHRQSLPQLAGGMYLTDSGLETTLVFHEGMELPHFAAFDLYRSPEGREVLDAYFRRHAKIARAHRMGFILESATWRASADWGALMGLSEQDLADINRTAIADLIAVRAELAGDGMAMVVSGQIGPRGDGYDPGQVMTVVEAEEYHRAQIRTFADTKADMVTAMTMTNVPEAIGLTRAAQRAGIPVVLAFTVETDGRLPTGQPLSEAIQDVDAATTQGPAYYMINCAHPSHFDPVLENADWMRRVRGLRANASRCSHAELDEAEVLDDGNPRELGAEYADILTRFPWINVLGGCCGTDHRHIAEIAACCLEVA